MNQGISALQEFARSGSSNTLSVIALMESGKALASQSQIDQSILVFKDVINHPDATVFLRNSARLSLSALLEQKKQWAEAEMMLERHSGDEDKPRILGAFNEPTPEWLSMFMFAFFTDRDGKYQLASLAESAFDPLARTCQFMLTEEAHHMFVGESGVMRIVQRACEVMDEIGSDDSERVRQGGAIDLPTLQKWINFHYSVSLDLFGQELSTNAANYYTQSLKGRFHEEKIDDDHILVDATYPVHMLQCDKIVEEDHSALTAINEKLRQDYIDDCQRGLNRWNKVIEKHGYDFRFKLPHRGFHRAIGNFAEVRVSPDGRVISEAEWTNNLADWLPTSSDRDFVTTVMKPCYEQGKIAGWIAPPTRGIHGNPFDYEYVKFNS